MRVSNLVLAGGLTGGLVPQRPQLPGGQALGGLRPLGGERIGTVQNGLGQGGLSQTSFGTDLSFDSDSLLQRSGGGGSPFTDTPDAVSAYLKVAADTTDAVQAEMDALLQQSQGTDFSALAGDQLEQSGEAGEAGGSPEATGGSSEAEQQPTAPNLTDGSTKLSDVDPDSVPLPGADDKRPPGDNRTAQEIIDQNPALKNLGNQGSVPKVDAQGKPTGENGGMRDGLKQQCGDFEHDPDAAYRAVEVLNYIKTCKQADGKTARSGDLVDNGKIEGITHDGDARHGTEAGMLQDFGKQGYGFLKGTNHSLQTTNDSHVRADGTNMSNIQWVGHQILHGLSEAFKWIAKITEKVLGKIPGIGKLIASAADLVDTAISGALNAADTALKHGDVGKAWKDMGADMVGAAVNIVDPTGLAGDAASNAVRQKIGG